VSGDPDAAARARVAALLDRIARVELQVVVVAPPDATRRAARERARDAAIVAGRGVLLDEATGAAREAALRAFAGGGFSGTWAATEMAASVATSSDRVAAAAAFEEAAIAAVVEDLVDEETLDVLRSTSNELDRSTGIPLPGSLSAFAAPAAGTMRGPLQVALLAVFLALGAAVALALGLAAGLLVLAVGVVVVAATARRGRRSDA
jgi:hypothetical protein